MCSEIGKKCADILEELGDAALISEKHGEAIARYTSALSFDPANKVDILVKRSRARASEKLWEDALMDANHVRAVLGYAFRVHHSSSRRLSWIPHRIGDTKGNAWRFVV